MAERPVMTREAIASFLENEFRDLGTEGQFIVEDVGDMTARTRLVFNRRHLRSGGTMSGPAVFALADVGIYIALLAQIGPVAMALTTTMTINYLSRPPAGDLVADCRILKLGRRLATGEARIHAPGSDELLSFAVGSYSMPPRPPDA